MAGRNHVELRGIARLVKHYPAANGKKALSIGSIKPSAQGPYFVVKAWEQAAEDFANADGLVVTVRGRLDYDKPREKSDAPWPMIVVIEKVIEHEPETPF